MHKWACRSTNLIAKIPNSSTAVQNMRTKQWPAVLLFYLLNLWQVMLVYLQERNETTWIFGCAHSALKLSDLCSCRRKKEIKKPSSALWEFRSQFHSELIGALKVSSLLGQSWSEFICCVYEPHLNPVWMKVNTFTMVTIVHFRTE